MMDAVLRKFYKYVVSCARYAPLYLKLFLRWIYRSRSDHFWKRPQTWENSR